MIELRTLGSLELRDSSGRDLDDVLAQPKRIALLTYLVLSPVHQRRDTLVAHLWPDLDHPHTRRALRQAIYYLRRRLGEDLILTRGQEEVGVDREAIRCDALALGRAFEAGDLRRVMKLYRGELMPGFHVSNVAPEFEHWLDGERFRARSRAQEAAGRLADASEQAGDFREAARWVRRWLRIQPTDERAVGRLMSLMDRYGDRPAAIREYEAFRKRLEEEWGIQPSEETRSLVGQLQRGRRSEVQARERKRRLPRPSSPLIGRRAEAEAVAHLLHAPDVHLITLTGAGGSGKSRLAIEVATQLRERYREGVFFVPLASIREAEGVPRSLAQALGMEVVPTRPLMEQLKDHLIDFEALLVLDNFEQVLEASDQIEELLAWTSVDLLVTSRIPLRISGEHEFRVPPLTLPDPDRPLGLEVPLDSEAVALFVERARAVDREFRLTEGNLRSVIEICRRLDGLPLAIELAAARMNALPLKEIAERLDRPFALLTRGPRHMPHRHRTLEATVRWTCDLLAPEERDLFHGLSVFRGGFGLEAVEAVWPGNDDLEAIDALSVLVDASLIQRDDDHQGNARYAMLETLRGYASLQLDRTGTADTWRRRHTEHFADWANEGTRFYCTVDEGSWLKRLDGDYENLCAALEWSVGSREGETAGKLASALWWYWWVRGYAGEGRRWIGRALRDAGEISEAVRARSLTGWGALASAQGDHEEAIAAARESLSLARKTGDKTAEASALQNLGFAYREDGDLHSAEAVLQEALALSRVLKNDLRAAVSLFSLGSIARAREEYEAATPLLRESRFISERMGDRGRVAHALLELGRIACATGDLEEADTLLEESREIFEVLGQKADLGESLERLAEVASKRGDQPRVRTLLAQVLEIYSDVDYRPGFLRTLLFFLESALDQGRAERAARLLGGLEAEIQDGRPVNDAEFRQRLEQTRESLSAHLGPDGREEFIEAGRALTREQLLVLATEKARALERKLASR